MSELLPNHLLPEGPYELPLSEPEQNDPLGECVEKNLRIIEKTIGEDDPSVTQVALHMLEPNYIWHESGEAGPLHSDHQSLTTPFDEANYQMVDYILWARGIDGEAGRLLPEVTTRRDGIVSTHHASQVPLNEAWNLVESVRTWRSESSRDPDDTHITSRLLMVRSDSEPDAWTPITGPAAKG